MPARIVPNLHFMYREHEFLDRFAAARRDGFGAVEFCFAYDLALDDVRRALADTGQQLVSFNFPAGELQPGQKRGIACLPGHEKQYADHITLGLEWARTLDCRQAIAPLAGMIPRDLDKPSCMAVYVENMKRAVPMLERANVTLLVEPNNTVEHPNYLISLLDDARFVVDAIDSSQVRMLFDTFHTQMMEGNLLKRYRDHAHLISHIQLGGVPGRHEPDVGEIDHRFLIHAIQDLGFTGWIAAEYFPEAATSSGLSWIERWGLIRG